MTVEEMLGRMSSRELAEWFALFRIEAKEAKQQYLNAKAAAAGRK